MARRTKTKYIPEMNITKETYNGKETIEQYCTMRSDHGVDRNSWTRSGAT